MADSKKSNYCDGVRYDVKGGPLDDPICEKINHLLQVGEKITIGRYTDPFSSKATKLSEHHGELKLMGDKIIYRDTSTNGTDIKHGSAITHINKTSVEIAPGDSLILPSAEGEKPYEIRVKENHIAKVFRKP